MQLVVSRSYPVIDAQTLAEYVARDSRDALLWLNETTDALGSYWHFAESVKRSYRPQDIAELKETQR